MVVAGACSAAPRTSDTTAADKGAKKSTAKDTRGLVREVYTAVRRGHGANMQTLLADDAFAIGPAAGDLFTSRNDIVVAASERFAIADRHRVNSRGLLAISSPSSHSAWVADRVDIDRTRYTQVAVLAQVDDIWYAVAAHLGHTASSKPPDRLPPLPGGVQAGAQAAVDLVREGAADPALFLEQFAGRWDTAVFGPGKRDFSRGKKRIKRLWKKRKIAKTPLSLEGDPSAGVTPDGALAWVAANVRAGDAPPRRLFWIYERADEGWRLVLMQWASPTES